MKARTFVVVVSMVGLLLLAVIARPPHAAGQAGDSSTEPDAGSWQTYVLTSGSEIEVPPPSANDSPETLEELRKLKNPLESLPLCPGTLGPQTTDTQAIVEFWNAAPAFKRWTEINLKLITARGTNTPQAHRGLALLHAASYDVVVATWFWKYAYGRPSPDQLDDSITPTVDPPPHPAYPSEHAAIARAAAHILENLFPSDATELDCLAEQAALSRLHARTNYHSDIDAGKVLGAAVASLSKTRRAQTDGSSATWDCNTAPLPKIGVGFWQTTSDPISYCPEDAPFFRRPTEPLAGTWQTWVTDAAVPASPPPGYNLYGTLAVCDLLEEVITDPVEGVIASVNATRAESEAGSACTNALDDDGDGFVNDGCSAFEDPLLVEMDDACTNAIDDDGDGRINEGCPTSGLSAESGAQCANAIDDDLDGIVNDGCRLAESGAQCSSAADNDGDGRVNDGCAAVGARNDVVNFWAGAPGNRWNLLALSLISGAGLNLPRAARVAGYVNLAGVDSLYASWASKYQYWTLRPENAIRQQCSTKPYFNSAFRSVRATPRDPSYTSGLSTVSGAVSEILAFFFPKGAVLIPKSVAPRGVELRSVGDAASQAAQSRLFDGTHWRHDNETGLAVGREIAQQFIERAKRDGAHPVR